MKWHGRRDRLGCWTWSVNLPNGWAANVSDHSQMIAPRQATEYHVAAICTHWIRQGGKFPDLETAKSEALKLAMSQTDSCAGPATPYHYASGTSRIRGK